MAISYEEALETLQSMFEDPWTRETLDAVLRNKKGHMENTVDFILRHSGKDPQKLVEQLQNGINPDEATMSMDEELARQLARGPSSRAAGAQAKTKKGRGAPTTLPDDFLRIPGRTATSTTTTTMESDAALARMLQDELFTEELARNPDFAHLARGRSSRSSTNRPAAASGRSNHQQPARVTNSPQIAEIGKKISELGDNARKRLQLLAAQFNARANPNGQSAAAASGSPTSAASERRGLLDDNDYDDLELAARKDL